MNSWPLIQLNELLIESRITDENPNPDKKIRVKLHCKGVEKRPLIAEKRGATKTYIRKAGQFIYGKQNFHKGAFGIIPDDLDSYSSSGDLPAFDVKDSCLPEWIFYWFKTNNRYLHLAKHAKGVGSQRVNVKSFLQEEILLPSVNDQKWILDNIKKSNKVMEVVSIENQNQSSYLTKLRQTILQEAIEGKLTAQWRKENPDIEPASVLLEKIKAEKAQLVKEKKIKKQKALPPISGEEKPFELPDGWEWCRLGEVTYGFQYGTSSKSFEFGECPVLRMGNIQNGDIIWNDLVYSSDKEEIQKFKLIQGDLLFNRTNSRELVGKTGLYKGERDSIYAGYLIRFHMAGLIVPNYTNFVLNSPLHANWCNEVKSDAIGQSNINATKLSNFRYPLPPLPEQKAIATKVEKLLALCDQLETRITRNQAYADQLMQAVLKEAFDPDGQKTGEKTTAAIKGGLSEPVN